MNATLFALPGNETAAKLISGRLGCETGQCILRQFPDGETYLRLESDVRGKTIILLCTLDRPDAKIIPLYFFAGTLRKAGARKILLVAPYLAYMRQDKQFHPGESVTSEHFAALLSSFTDGLITVDPHLHRRKSLNEIYTVPSVAVHAAEHIAEWIKQNVKQPVLVGPDGESGQWVSEVAKLAGAPFTVLTKERTGDAEVKISVPHIAQFRNTHTPVLVDDIISTGRTMTGTIAHLREEKMKPTVCIGIHAVFSGDAYSDLKRAGVEKVVTCNTIPHESNAINVLDSVAGSIGKIKL
ncbi:MAG TPA: ribose-phosphate pyrophosphokinase [Bacteroidia bacterium]|nr:ribose-phosphate pyrophosphokinase [Bacteroidia bacterium]